jgi:uncharacterized membrane protein SpoIIM required for sporulation
VLAAAGLLLVPAVWAYWAAATDAAIRDALVPARLREVMQQGKTWTDFAAEVRPALATIIFTNNIRVSFLAFAGGALFGLGTVFVLVANGIQLGAILGAAHHYGVAAPLLAFVSPHGYLELTSIAIAAAGGLMLGYAELRPGLQRRRDALTRAARRAVELVLGAAPVLVISGLIEGLVSPSRLPAEAKFALGPAAWLLLLAGLLTIARPPRTRVE